MSRFPSPVSAAVPPGASNGITKNFQVLMEVLGTFKDTGDSGAKPKLHVELQVRPSSQWSHFTPRIRTWHCRFLQFLST